MKGVEMPLNLMTWRSIEMHRTARKLTLVLAAVLTVGLLSTAALAAYTPCGWCSLDHDHSVHAWCTLDHDHAQDGTCALDHDHSVHAWCTADHDHCRDVAAGYRSGGHHSGGHHGGHGHHH